MFTKLYWFEFQAKVTLVRGLLHDQWLGISIKNPDKDFQKRIQVLLLVFLLLKSYVIH